MKNKKVNNLPIPKVGDKLHFYDDGKINLSRHYVATVKRILTYEEASKTKYKCSDYDFDGTFLGEIEKSVLDVWKEEIEDDICNLYSEDTDVFIECSIPEYELSL